MARVADTIPVSSCRCLSCSAGACDSSGGISSVADLDSIALQPNEMAGVTYIFMALVAIAWLFLAFECWAHKRKDHPALRRLNKSLGFVEPGTEERILRMHTERAQIRKAAVSLRSLSQQAAAGGAAASSGSQAAEDTATVPDAVVVPNALHAAAAASAASAAAPASVPAAGTPPAGPEIVATRLSTVMKGAVLAVRASSSMALPRVSMSGAVQQAAGGAACASGTTAPPTDAGAPEAMPLVSTAAPAVGDGEPADVAPDDTALRIAFRATSSRIASARGPLSQASASMPAVGTPTAPVPASSQQLHGAASAVGMPPASPP